MAKSTPATPATTPPPVRKPRLVKTEVSLVDKTVAVYAGEKVANALREVSGDMDLWKGAKLAQLLEALYKQGKKDGAREVKEGFEQLMEGIVHQNPGQPKKRKKGK